MNSSDPFLVSKLISKSLKGELSAMEEEQFSEWLQASEQNRLMFEKYKDEYSLQSDLMFFETFDMNHEWKNIHQKIQQEGEEDVSDKPVKRLFSWFWFNRKISIAAMLIITSVAAFIVFSQDKDLPIASNTTKAYKNDVLPGKQQAILVLSSGQIIDLNAGPNRLAEKDGTLIKSEEGRVNYLANSAVADKEIFNTLIVPKGGNYELVLPDGTRVWLNSESKLRFPVSFKGSTREVDLSGEGYFEVAGNPDKPFNIKANGATIQVLGTSFNLNAYEPAITTTLVEGSVKLMAANNAVSGLLSPGQSGTISSGRIDIKKADFRKALAWKNGEFYFKKDRLVDILKQVGSWYDIEVEIERGMEDIKISGSLDRKAKLSEVILMLKYLTKGRFELAERKLVVSKEK